MEDHLPSELEQFAEHLIASGRYASRAEVLESAMWQLLEVETLRDIKLARLKAEVQKGLDDIEAGRTKVLDCAMIERIKAEGRQRLADRAQQKRPA